MVDRHGASASGTSRPTTQAATRETPGDHDVQSLYTFNPVSALLYRSAPRPRRRRGRLHLSQHGEAAYPRPVPSRSSRWQGHQVQGVRTRLRRAQGSGQARDRIRAGLGDQAIRGDCHNATGSGRQARPGRSCQQVLEGRARYLEARHRSTPADAHVGHQGLPRRLAPRLPP